MSNNVLRYSPAQQARVNAPKVIPINETDMRHVPMTIARWLDRQYPGHDTKQMALVKQNNRIFARVNIQTASGQLKTLLFDITMAAQNNMNTMVQRAPVGTLVRLQPSTTLTPTRIERLF